MSTAAVLLAAGGSTRLGQPKQLLKIDGESLVHRSARTLLAASVRPVVVVLGAHAEDCAGQLNDLPVQIALNPRWQEGLASSIRIGVAELRKRPGVTAAVLALCDQPFLESTLIEALIAEHTAKAHPVVASLYQGIAGVPALFSERCFDDLAALEGEAGARKVIAKYSAESSAVPFPGGDVDIDTAEDWSKLSANH